MVGELVPEQVYSFNVAARAKNGVEALYEEVKIKLGPDDVNPLPGGQGNLANFDHDGDSFTLSWDAAIDNFYDSETLLYKVCLSKGAPLETLDEAMANCVQQSLWSQGLTSVKIEGLMPGRDYHFNVLVKDPAQNTALYQTAVVSTPAFAGNIYVVDDDFDITNDPGSDGLSAGDPARINPS